MKTTILELNEEEAIIVHNAVIFMANDVMEDLMEFKNWLDEQKDKKQEHTDELKERWRRWEVMMCITERVKKRDE